VAGRAWGEEPAAPAASSEDDPACEETHAAAASRTLGPHRFLYPRAFHSPFTSTHFALRQGGGYLRIPGVLAPGYDTPYDLQLVGVTETLELGVRLHPSLGLFLDATGELNLGVNADSAFFLGGRGAFVGEIGVLAVPLRREPRGTQLTVRGWFRARLGHRLEPSPLIDAVIERQEETLGDVLEGDVLKYMLSREQAFSGGAGLVLAQALGKPAGLQVSVSTRWGGVSRFWYDGTRDVRERLPFGAIAAGLTLELDGAPRFPLAAQLEYHFRLDLERTPADEGLETRLGNRHLIGGGVYFTGRDDLQLGLTAAGVVRSPAASVKETYVLGEFVIRYFFR
jgi:hypothetical protein